MIDRYIIIEIMSDSEIPAACLGAPIAIHAPAPRLGLLGQLGQCRGLVRIVTIWKWSEM